MWYVYIIYSQRLKITYTGITTNVLQRLKAHNEGTGAKFTRNKGPWELLGSKPCMDKSEASKEEIRIKKLSQSQKIELALEW